MPTRQQLQTLDKPGGVRQGRQQTEIRARSGAARPAGAAAVLRRAVSGTAALSPTDVLELQRTIGNRAVVQLLAKDGAPGVQAKLSVGRAGDQYEQEADRVAKQVAASPYSGPEQVHRQAEEEEEEAIQTKPGIQRQVEEEEEEALQAKPRLQLQPDGSTPPVPADVESAIERSRGGGQAVDSGVRPQMESAFDADFSGVRVHTGPEADGLNRALGARAFTTGQDIFFGDGEYSPSSSAGRETLAHELTHVVQQNGRTALRRRSTAAPTAQSAVGRDVALQDRQTSLDSSSVPELKTKFSTGGLTGITLDVTLSVTDTPCDGLQVVQVFWGDEKAIGQHVGKMRFTRGKQKFDAFVDGGKNSPWVTLSGNKPAHRKKPYYLTSGAVASQVTFDGKNGTIKVYDKPTASAHYDNMNFETAIVAINHKGKGKDVVLKSFTWGFTAKGKKRKYKGQGVPIGGKKSSLKATTKPSATWAKIVKHDYPGYRYV